MTTAHLTRNQLRMAICLVLLVATAGVYWPMLQHGFICFDDDAYVVGNQHVTRGLTWSGTIWAFQSGYAANWHPLTWISHMLDCQLYGLHPAGHHLTNLLLHVANALLLFLWLSRLTGTIWRSAFVAALFAWHPTHVESVAWASERKDVLCAFFWMLTLLAYTRFAEKSKTQSSNSKFYYGLSLLAFACALMSKPMAVTLPFVLLLLDYWPLGRIAACGMRSAEFKMSREAPDHNPDGSQANPQFSTLNPQSFIRSGACLILEKLPFFALALAGSIVTFLVQRTGGAVLSTETLPLSSRLENIPLAYVRYLGKCVWPTHLAVLYPYHSHHSLLAISGAILMLATVTGLCLWRVRRYPYALVGWLWFLGILVPTIGLVQVGSQSIADRYLYLPSIGLFILMAWGLNDFVHDHSHRRPAVALAGATALAGFLVCTWIQLGYWQNNLALLSHTIAVTTDNYTIYNSLGAALELAGQKDDAFLMYSKSVQIEPRFAESQYNLGMALLRRGWPEKASEHLAAAVKLSPDTAKMRYSFGVALADTGHGEEAFAEFTETLRLDPGYADAHNRLALACLQLGKTNDAIVHFTEVFRRQPTNAEACFNLGLALLNNHQPAEAAGQFAKELQLAPDEPKAHYRLAQALLQQDRPAEAVQHFREALRLKPDFSEAQSELDKILAAHPELR
ncbi:MAG TPA: tetratricopeptide repeat protein [Candidatus Acidoferrum sp.]|nr:tetratricopeptide repeat protein [Candidatus Acidoferrum sp.]